MFSSMYCNGVFVMGDKNDVGLVVCANIVVFVSFGNGDNCTTFSKRGIVLVLSAMLYMKYYLIILNDVILKYLVGSGLGCFRYLIFIPSGPV